jgi:hypothetical protein
MPIKNYGSISLPDFNSAICEKENRIQLNLITKIRIFLI